MRDAAPMDWWLIPLLLHPDVYHDVGLAAVAKGTSWTHVCTSGVVHQARPQDDGDWHIDLRWPAGSPTTRVMLEIPPWWSLGAPPRRGQAIIACGITRTDRRHRWQEIHPLLWWMEVP